MITFNEPTGFRISEGQCDLTTGKVVVNNIEITTVEDWEKVTKSLVDLQQQNEFLTKRENKLQTIEQMYKSGSVDLDKLRKIVMEEK